MNTMDIAQQRLHHQGLLAHSFQSPEEVVRWLGAVQAQEYTPSLWALGARMPPTIMHSDIVQAIESGKILRTWLMRGTIHYVTAEDAMWMVRLLAPRVNKKYHLHYARVGLTPEILSKGKKVLLQALHGGVQLTRKELYGHFQEVGIDTKHMLGVSILQYWAQEGLVCFGPNRDTQSTISLLDDVAGHGHIFETNDALRELAVRYFTSHGPATAQDLAWWSGLTATEVKQSIELAGEQLKSVSHDGKLYWQSANTSIAPAQSSTLLLPCFDEYTVGYKDRSVAIEDNLLRDNGYAVNNNNIVCDGRIVGSWKFAREGGVVFDFINPLDRERLQKVNLAAERVTGFFAR